MRRASELEEKFTRTLFSSSKNFFEEFCVEVIEKRERKPARDCDCDEDGVVHLRAAIK